MRRISTVCLALLVITSCHSGQIAEGPPKPSVQEGPPMMESKQVGWTPVQLSPGEKDGLKKAIENSPSNTPMSTSHIHADVKNGALVFSPEKEQVQSHVTGSDSRITFGNAKSQAVTVVATPSAAKLLEQKAAVAPH